MDENINYDSIRLDVDNNWSSNEFANLINGLSNLYNLSYSFYKAEKINHELTKEGLSNRIAPNEIYHNIDKYISNEDNLILKSISMNSPGFFEISGISPAIAELRHIIEAILDAFTSTIPTAVLAIVVLNKIIKKFNKTENEEEIQMLIQQINDFIEILKSNKHVKINKN